MSQGSLSQLVSQGAATQSHPTEFPMYRYIHSPATIRRMCKIEDTQNEKKDIVTREHDIGYIRSIVVPQTYSPTFDDCIVIEVGASIVWYMPLKLLEGMYGSTPVPHTSPPMKQIKLPHNLFPIILIAFQYNSVEITLKCCTDSYITYSAIMLDTEPRRHIARTSHTYDIVSCSNLENDALNVNIRRTWGGPTIGFFVDTSFAPTYTGTELSLNGHTRGTFTPDFSEPLPHSSSILYYPLIGGSRAIDSMSPIQYTQTSLNMSIIDNIHMKHNTSLAFVPPDSEERLRCFVLTRNTVNIRSGTMVLRFSYNNLGVNPLSHHTITPTLTFTERTIGPDEDGTCCITFDTIGDNVQYAKCQTCKHNFTYEPFYIWVQQSYHRKCPICRTGTTFTYHINIPVQ